MAWVVVGPIGGWLAKTMVPRRRKWATQAITAIALSVLLPFLGLSGIASAQSVTNVPSGDDLVTAQVMAPATAQSVSPTPLWGAVLGAVVVAGLLYLVTRGPDGNYYRYPYYGSYYQHYYRPSYRPYTGFYPASAPLITVAAAILGTVLGTVMVNGYPYIVSSYGGQYYRYPYYGPYHQYYYRPTYRPYTGANVNVYVRAPVRQGDSRWDTPSHTNQPYGSSQQGGPHQQQSGPHQSGGKPQNQQCGGKGQQPCQNPGNQSGSEGGHSK